MVWALESTEIWGERGFMGVTGSEWRRYHANTVYVVNLGSDIKYKKRGVGMLMFGKGCIPLCPYLAGSELAPATAKRGDEKKIFRAASDILDF